MALACAPSERRSPRTAAYWLWMLAIGTGSVLVAFLVTNAVLPVDRAVTRNAFGQDFLAFYSAGKLVDVGRLSDLYDLNALSAIQHTIAEGQHLRLAADVAPWWNPPYVAWLFVPFSRLAVNAALLAWTGISLVLLGVAAFLLLNIIRATSERKRDWMLVPALLFVAPPTIQALGHGQNTPLSLLLLTLTVLAWRARRPLLTGLACAALCYKPQLAAIVGLAAFATLGWRVAVGAMLGLVPLLLLTLCTMPGVLTAFLKQVPANLRHIQFDQPYLWHRHATFEGFFRFLFQGNAAAVTRPWIHALSLAGIVATLVILGTAAWKLRTLARREPGDEELTLDRFIALVILATPLAMPFFFDYDLLLLAIPCVLTAREMMLAEDRSRIAATLQRLFPLAYLWLAGNPPLAEAYGLNLTVPLLVVMLALQAHRCIHGVASPAIEALPEQTPALESLPERQAA